MRPYGSVRGAVSDGRPYRDKVGRPFGSYRTNAFNENITGDSGVIGNLRSNKYV
jgi:hypothetical protein